MDSQVHLAKSVPQETLESKENPVLPVLLVCQEVLDTRAFRAPKAVRAKREIRVKLLESPC